MSNGLAWRLRREFSSSGRVDLFDHLEPHLWGWRHSHALRPGSLWTGHDRRGH